MKVIGFRIKGRSVDRVPRSSELWKWKDVEWHSKKEKEYVGIEGGEKCYPAPPE